MSNLSDSIPQLARFYMDANKKVFGKGVYVHARYFGKFRVFEDELRERSLSPREYSYTVAKLLVKWCSKRGMDHVPINVFLGDWALGKFIKVAGSRYVDISNTDVEEEVYYSERLVANAFVYDNTIGGKCVKFSKLVTELRGLLSRHWMWRYGNGGDRHIDKVLEEMCSEYGIRHAGSYYDIIDMVNNGEVQG